ncbi:MAG: PDDEXK nuclease domain-containing protein [Methanobacterium sp.]
MKKSTIDENEEFYKLIERNPLKVNVPIRLVNDPVDWLLTYLLVERDPDYYYGDFIMKFAEFKIDKILEKDVEDKLYDNIKILNKFGHDLEVKCRQKRCIGDEGIIDLLCVDKNEGNYVVIELKIVKANSNTFGQISSYIGWVMDHKPTDKPVKGIVISRGYDENFKSALKTIPNIEHIELIDVLLELDMKVV